METHNADVHTWKGYSAREKSNSLVQGTLTPSVGRACVMVRGALTVS